MNHLPVIGIDMGATNIRGAIVENGRLHHFREKPLNTSASFEELLEEIFGFIESLIKPGINGIGIGVPGLVDQKRNMVVDVLNISSWKETPLAGMVEERFGLPVMIANDANCFALGEYYFGKGQGHHSLVGVTIGTGLGTGIVIEGKAWAGSNGGAGEFGLMDYLDRNLEYYASGQYFRNVHGVEGTEVYRSATAGNRAALEIYREFGRHLGRGLRLILYSIDPDIIVLGGSISKAYDFFSTTMYEELSNFAFSHTIERLNVELTSLQNSGILGAAALHLAEKKSDY